MPKKESAKDRAAAKADAAESARAQAAEDAKWADGAKSGDKKARVTPDSKFTFNRKPISQMKIRNST
jgi:hypothetical protein